MNWRGLAFQGMEEEGILGRWSMEGVGSELSPVEWLVKEELAEECQHWNLAVEEEGTVEVG